MQCFDDVVYTVYSGPIRTKLTATRGVRTSLLSNISPHLWSLPTLQECQSVGELCPVFNTNCNPNVRHGINKEPLCVQVLLGNNELLHDEVVECSVNSSTYVVTSPTPPSPMHGTVTLRVCNEHQFCDHAYFDIK